MREFAILIAPVLWSIKNDIFRLNRSFYRRVVFYAASGGIFLFLFTRLLNIGMAKLQSMSAEVFGIILIKGYSLIFMVVFFMQIANGFIISLNSFFQARDLEVLFTSPVNRTSLFFSRLFGVHVKASWMLIIFGIPLIFASGVLYRASLLYYGSALILFAIFSTISVNIGAALSLFLSTFFHVRRMKKILLSTGVIAIALLVTLLRLFRPERFVNPELFANLTLFITEVKTPSFILLPNRWISESIFALLGKSPGSTALIFIALLFLTSYITTLFLMLVFKRYHYRGWGLLQEGDFVRMGRSPRSGQVAPRRKEPMISEAIQRLLLVFGKRSRTLMRKDLLCQIRDERNVHQILILVSVVVIYLFSIAALPLNWVGYEVQLKYIVSFLNLGVILIIVASLCSRLVYPAIVSEGPFLWIMKTTPLTPKRYIWTKFLFYCAPLFLTGQLLAILSSFIIVGIETAFIILQSATTALLSLSLPAMAVSFGASDMKRLRGDSPEVQVRTESVSYMLVSIFLIFFTMALEIAPVFLYFLRESGQIVFTRKAWTVIGGIMFLLFIVNLLVAFFSLRAGVKKIEKFDL